MRRSALYCAGLLFVLAGPLVRCNGVLEGGDRTVLNPGSMTDADFSPVRLEQLRRQLDSPDLHAREMATYELRYSGPESRDSIPRLVELLSDDTVLARGILTLAMYDFARECLADLDAETVTPISEAIPLQSTEARRESYQVLAAIGLLPRELLRLLAADFEDARTKDRMLLLATISAVDRQGDVALPLLIAGLEDPDPNVRVCAAINLSRTTLDLPWTLQKLRPRGAPPWVSEQGESTPARGIVEALLQAVKRDSDPEARAHAIRSLATYDAYAEHVVPALVTALNDPDDYVWMLSPDSAYRMPVAGEAARGLVHFPESAGRTLPELLKATIPEGLSGAGTIYAMSELSPRVPAFVSTVIDSLDEQSNPVLMAVIARGGPRAAAAIPALSKLLQTDEQRNHLAAAATLACVDREHNGAALNAVAAALANADWDALTFLCHFLTYAGPGAEPLVPLLIRHLVKEGDQPYLETDVLPVIKAIGPAAIDAAPQIIEHLKADYTVSATSDALLAMGPETLPLLANAIRSDRFSPDKNRIFLKLLARFGADAASTVPTIIPHMTSRYPRVREAAARALGAIGSQPELSLPALGQAIGDPRPFVRAAAAESLAVFPDNAAETVPQLANALRDEYLDVRVAAATALGLLGEAAMPALPELNQLAHDPNLLIREMAREAVDRISQP